MLPGWWICTCISGARQTHKEDIHSGCRAAAAGGVTSVVCMPNTTPACDTPERVRWIRERAVGADARVYPAAAITASLGGETLTDFDRLKEAGAVAVTDDGRPVPTADKMMQAMEKAAACGLPVLSHCEELTLVRGGIMNEGAVSRSLAFPASIGERRRWPPPGKSPLPLPPAARCIFVTSVQKEAPSSSGMPAAAAFP